MIEVICFFENLHSIRAFLQNTWVTYGDGEINIVTAAMTANATLRLVKPTEEALVRKLQRTQSHINLAMRDECSYQDLVCRLRPTVKVRNLAVSGDNRLLQ